MSRLTLPQAMAAIMTIVATDENIKQAPTTLVESMWEFPFVLARPGGGVEQFSGGFRIGRHTLVIEIHCLRALLQEASNQAAGIYETMINTFLSYEGVFGNGLTQAGDISYEFGWLRWGDEREAHLGYHVEIPVKIVDY